MRKGVWLALAGVTVLAGCQNADQTERSGPAEVAADMAAAPAGSGEAATVAAPPLAQIAYAYRYALSLPGDRGAEMMSRHELACVSAGPALCQVLSAQADWTGRDPSGHLELRGERGWIDRFRSQLALDASGAGGRLESANTDGEDVTRDLNTATREAQTGETLAQRMRALEARRGGTMAQRLEVERELADLQHQLDASRIEATELNRRVETARLSLTYTPGGVLAADHPMRPVAQALNGAMGLSMGMLALLITAGSVMLPLAAIAGVVWWAMRRRRPAAA